VLRHEVENTCDQCYESSDYGVLEQQHDRCCILGLVLLFSYNVKEWGMTAIPLSFAVCAAS